MVSAAITVCSPCVDQIGDAAPQTIAKLVLLKWIVWFVVDVL